MKSLIRKQRGDTPHWVGDAFPVRSIFTYRDLARHISPFLLLDYAGPTEFEPSQDHVRGVGAHPHRGFETVTIVYAGQVEHRDSSGGGGVIDAGDVQWMTAGAGIVHEEKHGKEFAKSGGPFELIQLWVNLPKKSKMTPPRYQGLVKDQIPVVETDGFSLRVIAGEFAGRKGPAQTHSPMQLWDLELKEGQHSFEVTEGHTAALFVRKGEVQIPSGETIEAGEVGVLDPAGTEIVLEAKGPVNLLFMGGEPLDEPIVGYGPFVMNSPEELRQAFEDFQQGKMGALD